MKTSLQDDESALGAQHIRPQTENRLGSEGRAAGSSRERLQEEEAPVPAVPEGTEEGRIPRVKRTPKQPTPEEIREHKATHLPFRDWCPHCCFGRGVSDHHCAREEEEKPTIPTISIDYAYSKAT